MNRRALKHFWLVFLMLSTSACASVPNYEVVSSQNYVLGQRKHVAVGEAMIMREHITWTEEKRWVGLFNTLNGWETTRKPTSDSFREELIYTGRSGNFLAITYREYKEEFVIPAFFQSLTYDVSLSHDIVFQNYRLELLGADNKAILFVVVDD